MEIGWQGAGSGNQRWDGGRFLVNKQRDGKMTKRRREIGAAKRKNGFKEKEKEKEVEVEVDFSSPGREMGKKEEEDSRRRRRSRLIFRRWEGRWEESEEEKEDWRRSAGRKKGFKKARGRRQGEASGARQASKGSTVKQEAMRGDMGLLDALKFSFEITLFNI
ncbi:hypothetical protein ACLOJK_029013 [Asimina triloba]